MSTSTVPAVLTFAGLDPTGGAGLSADIEAITSMGCHALPIATAVTVQDSGDVHRVIPLAPADVLDQARTVLADISASAFKIGLIAEVRVADAICKVLDAHPDVPLVLDPVWSAGGSGKCLVDPPLGDAIRDRLLPRATIATPNLLEARRLAPGVNDGDLGLKIVQSGCRYVLVTGAHAAGNPVAHRLYGPKGLMGSYDYPRLPHEYHGSGCTLAASIAARLALGDEIEIAVSQSLDYTYETLRFGYALGAGQHFPRRRQAGSQS